jgi:HrpA-like RNA helicase
MGDVVQNIKDVGSTLLKDMTGHATLVNGVMICVLCAALPPEAPMLAFQPKAPGCRRKTILATNIGESNSSDKRNDQFDIMSDVTDSTAMASD